MPEYVVNFSGANSAELSGEKCILPISMGNKDDPRQEGERFEQTLKTLASSQVTEINIVITDSLYRHTMLLETALQLGRDWLGRNERYIDNVREEFPNVDIRYHHWQNFVEDEAFPAYNDKVLALYNDEIIKSDFDKTALSFIASHINESGRQASDSKDWNDRIQDNINFLIEEAAVLLLWQKLECKFLIYVNGQTDAIKAIYRQKDLILPGRLQYLILKFKASKVSRIQQEIKIPSQREDAIPSLTPFAFYAKSYSSTIVINPCVSNEALASLMRGFIGGLLEGTGDEKIMPLLAAEFGASLLNMLAKPVPSQEQTPVPDKRLNS